jgi:hypothetical protein
MPTCLLDTVTGKLWSKTHNDFIEIDAITDDDAMTPDEIVEFYRPLALGSRTRFPMVQSNSRRKIKTAILWSDLQARHGITNPNATPFLALARKIKRNQFPSFQWLLIPLSDDGNLLRGIVAGHQDIDEKLEHYVAGLADFGLVWDRLTAIVWRDHGAWYGSLALQYDDDVAKATLMGLTPMSVDDIMRLLKP